MLHKTKGVTLRTIKYSETSVIAKIYTEQFGMQSYIVNGVRHAKSGSKKALLQPGTLVDMVVYHRDGKDLQRISEIKPWLIYSAIPFDIVKGSITLFIIELLYRSVREEEQNSGLFNLVSESLTYLDKTDGPIGNFHLWFMIQLTAYLGFLPDGHWTGETCRFNMEEGCFTEEPSVQYGIEPFHAGNFSALLYCELEEAGNIEMTRQQRHELLDHLIDYYKLHMDHFKKVQSPAILQQVI